MGVSGADRRRELQDEALARQRTASPVAIAVLVTGLVSSEAAGIALAGWVIAYNVVALVSLAVLTWTGWKRKIPAQWAHAAAAATWLFVPFSSLTSLAATGETQLSLPIIAMLIAAPWVQASRVGLALTTVGTTIVWFTVAPPVDGPLTVELARHGVLGATVLANFAGFLGSRRFEERSDLQAQLRATNEQLVEELGERQRTQEVADGYRDQFIAAQRSEAIGSLAAGLAHEMNNILGGILTAAELLDDDSSDSSELGSAIAAEAKRGGALTQSLLAFARRGQYQRAPAPLDEIVEGVARLLPRTTSRDISVMIDCRSDVVIDVDRAQVMQAILNLALNGIDAMPEGGELTLTTSVESVDAERARGLALRPGRYAIVVVRDTGQGMDAKTRQRAFEPFFTTKPIGKGTGLGLAMVDGAVRAHEGSFEVQSVVDQGTTIRVFVPVYEGDAASAACLPKTPTQRSGRILIVDDEPLIRSSLSKMLESFGYTTAVAADGAAGLAAFEADHDIDLVVCDMNMPVMQGPEAIRAMAKLRVVPTVVISGYASAAKSRELIRSGVAHGFLEKPFSSRTLLDAIEAVMPATLKRAPGGAERQRTRSSSNAASL